MLTEDMQGEVNYISWRFKLNLTLRSNTERKVRLYLLESAAFSTILTQVTPSQARSARDLS